ncbi:energy transducer TonB [Parvibium lacunae]|uniref:TonB C-terminal domain-containing protein n=1 Tax=Parvibium lacunae TaxID=1888893 RepID=A0A368L3E9_9BURK|nr:energy transducer TonB [Parvibium lacunae]RCS58107.1 TonB C-terminal domain-containing protein [Parvibium lacunae]
MSVSLTIDTRHPIQRSQRWQLRSLGLAVLMHSLLLLGLLMHVDWRSRQTEAVEAEIWSSLPVTAGRPAPPPEPPVPPTPLAKPVERPAPAIQEKPAIALPEKKPPPPEKTPVTKPPVQTPASESNKQAEALREKLRQQELDRLFGKASPEAKGNDSQSTASRSQGRNDNEFASQVRGCIRPHIRKLATLNGNPEALYRIELLPDGTHIEVKLLKTSGQRTWDETVERAIRNCDPLPRPKTGSMPRHIDIGFRPLDDSTP